MATALPIPREAPVITATFPVSSGELLISTRPPAFGRGCCRSSRRSFHLQSCVAHDRTPVAHFLRNVLLELGGRVGRRFGQIGGQEVLHARLCHGLHGL